MSTTREATFAEKQHYISVVMKSAPSPLKVWLLILGLCCMVGPFVVVYPYWDITIAGVINMIFTMVFGAYFMNQYGGLSRIMGLAHFHFIGVIIYVYFRCFQDDIFGLSKVTGWQFWYLLCIYSAVLFISWIIDIIDVFRYFVLGDKTVIGIGTQKVDVDENDEIIQSKLQLVYF